MKKSIISVLTILTLFLGFGTQTGATSKYGVSANTTKANYNNQNITLYIKNDNNYQVGVEIQPQRFVNGKWKNLDWYDFEFVNKGKKAKITGYKKDFKKGKYRYVVKVNKYDKKGFEKPVGKFTTNKIKVYNSNK